MRSTTLSSVSKMIALGVLGTVVGLWASRPAEAFNPVPEPPHFGMFGMIGNQTARLSIVNTADLAGLGDVCGVSPVPYRLEFRDSEGNSLTSTRVRLRPGQAAFLDFKPAEFTPSLRRRERMQIRPLVEEVGGISPVPFFCGIVTVEVFGRDGRTTVIYGGHP